VRNEKSDDIGLSLESDEVSTIALERREVRRPSQIVVSHPGVDDRGDVFAAAINMTRMPMIVTDPNQPNNPIVFANKAFLDLTGYALDEIIHRNCRFLQGARTDRETVAELREAIAEGRGCAVEILNYKRDGTPFWNSLFVGPVFDEHGKLIYFFASQLDVTRRRTSEDAVRQGEKMEAIGQLTAGLAHDFNNLIHVMLGNLETASGLADNPRLERALTNARRAAERGEKITSQLLAFARKTRLEPKAINLNTLIVNFGEMLSQTLGAGTDLRLDLAPVLPECSVDPAHLEMALLNTLANARDAMPDGGTVTISTYERRHPAGYEDIVSGLFDVDAGEAENYICIDIADEGCGMPADVLERANEPFFTTKGLGRGTGLGLAMVDGFVKQSGGRLDIESRENVGTTISLAFPQRTRPPLAPEHEDAFDGAVRDAGDRKRRSKDIETILVVDDSPDALALAEDYLSTLGYRILTADDATQALEILARGESIDLLFTDLVMPGDMSGLQLAQEVERHWPRTAILLTTGYNEELVARGPPAPSMDVLGKPYRKSELADRVRIALNGVDRPRREPPSPFPHHEG
jgi:PAS domain S-box-containing protein